MLIACCTIIPCILAIPCFYIAGVKYSWHKYHEAMFMLDVWGEMEQWYQNEISKKRFYQMQMNPDPADPTNLSVSVDWKILRQQRKMKIKNFNNERIAVNGVKPTMKKRAKHFKAPGMGDLSKNLIKQKTVIANLKEDETPSEFPDTRSQRNDQSYAFQPYAMSFDDRHKLG